MNRLPSRRSGMVALGLAVLATAGCGGGSAQAPSGGSSAATSSGAASSAPGGSSSRASTFTSCPISPEQAATIAGEPMQVSPASLGDGTFRAETVGDVTTYLCTYVATTDPSARTVSLHVDFSVGSSADGRWSLIGADASSDPKVARLRGEVYEKVLSDEAGSREIGLTLHGPGYLITAGAAAYGTDHTLAQIRLMADAVAEATLTTIGVA